MSRQRFNFRQPDFTVGQRPVGRQLEFQQRPLRLDQRSEADAAGFKTFASDLQGLLGLWNQCVAVQIDFPFRIPEIVKCRLQISFQPVLDFCALILSGGNVDRDVYAAALSAAP